MTILGSVLEVVVFAIPVIGWINRRHVWGRRVAYVSTVIILVVYAAVPSLRQHVADEFLEGYTMTAGR